MSIALVQSSPPSTPRPLRFSLRTALVVVLFIAMVLGWAKDRDLLKQSREIAKIRIEIYTDQAEFERRLGYVQTVNFDDIRSTQPTDVVPFNADRYASQGIRIEGLSGQYVSGNFGLPADFLPVSPPNLYAPGPVGQNPGANSTEVTFTAKNRLGQVCGFGLKFVDVDFRNSCPSCIEVFDRHGNSIARHDAFTSANRMPVFRGIIAVDRDGMMVPVIARVRLTNGTGWPGRDTGDCVAMDDFEFDAPQ
jgi:hypothetical protein